MTISRLDKWFLIWAISLILGICFVGHISPAQAEPYYRVCKNGVIYYYFSQREGTRSPQLAWGSRPIHTIPPQTYRKLSPQEVEPVVQEASRHYNLPPTLIKAMIKVESNFVPTATSPKGAQGLMQLMPGTAEDLQVRNAYDIRENILAGTRYLYLMLEKFGYHLPMALAAYNAGPQRVEKHQDIPPIKETEGFVRDVCVNFLRYSKESTLSR